LQTIHDGNSARRLIGLRDEARMLNHESEIQKAAGNEVKPSEALYKQDLKYARLTNHLL